MGQIKHFVVLAMVVVVVATGARALQSGDSVSTGANQRRFEIHFLDVGQGDAALFIKGEEQLLVDGGPDQKVLMRLGKLMPVGDRRIETMILTHPHADHLRGLSHVLKNYEVEKVYFNGVANSTPEFVSFLEAARSEPAALARLYRGQKLEFAGNDLRTLWPPAELGNITDLNDSSVILQLTVYGHKVLFLGDASVSAQGEIRDDLGPVSILKVSHHGSKTGTSKEIVEILQPHYAVFSVGKNSYGHPAPSVLNLLAGSRVLETLQSGTISFWFDAAGAHLY